MMHHISHYKFTQIILGVVAILIPFIVGCFIWLDTKDTFPQKQATRKTTIENIQRSHQRGVYIYYQLGDKYERVNLRRHKTFEYENPNARICLSINDDHYCVPLDKMSAFVKKFGAQNVSLTQHDENDNPSKGLNILEVPGFRF